MDGQEISGFSWINGKLIKELVLVFEDLSYQKLMERKNENLVLVFGGLSYQNVMGYLVKDLNH